MKLKLTPVTEQRQPASINEAMCQIHSGQRDAQENSVKQNGSLKVMRLTYSKEGLQRAIVEKEEANVSN